MPDNFFTYIGSAILALFTANAGLFMATGLTVFKLTAALVLGLFGAETVLTNHFDTGRFIRLMFSILICLTMLTYYSTPAPMLGRSFHHVITDEAKYLSDQLEGGANQMLQDKLNDAYLQMETPGPTLNVVGGFVQTAAWFLAVCLIAALRLAMLAVVGFSYMAIGIIVLLGPIFIPSLLWPGLEWIFWGWLKSFYSYALYQIVASAMVFIIANVMVRYFDANPGPYTLETIETNIIELAVICGLGIYSLFKVPSLAASIGRGSGGESIVRDSL